MIADLLDLHTIFGLVFIYCIAPYTVLWLAVKCWPKGHPRRAEYLAEYDVVPTWRRPFWVADATVRSILDGTTERWNFRLRTISRLKARVPSRTTRAVENGQRYRLTRYRLDGDGMLAVVREEGIGLPRVRLGEDVLATSIDLL